MKRFSVPFKVIDTLAFIEIAMIFVLCATLPLIFARAVGSDEMFYLVKDTALEIGVCALIALRLVRLALDRGHNVPQWPGIAVAAFAAWLCASPAWTAHLPSTLRAAAYFLSLLALYGLCATHPNRRAVYAAVLGAVLIGGAASAAHGVFDFFFPPETPLFLNWGNRTAGLFSDPNFFGIFVVFPMFAGFGIALSAVRSCAMRGAGFIVGISGFVALVLSYSRSAWVAAAAGVVVFCFFMLLAGAPGKRLRAAALMIAIIAALTLGALAAARLGMGKSRGFALPARAATITVFFNKEAAPRKLLWRSAEGMIRAKPGTGYGPGTFQLQYHPFQLALRGPKGYGTDVEWRSKHTYNDFLQIGAETGLVGLGLWLMALGAMFAGAWRGAKERGPEGAGEIAAVFAFFACGVLFQYPIYNAAAAALAMAVLGALQRAQPFPKSDPRPEPETTPARIIAFAVPAVIVILIAAIWIYVPYLAYKYSNKGIELSNEGKPKSALKMQSRAVKLMPGNPNFQFLYALSLLNLVEQDPYNYDRAVAALQLSLKSFPYNASAYQRLAFAYQNQGEFKKAIEALEQAEKYYYGDRYDIEIRIIRLLQQTGVPYEAKRRLETLIKENPDNKAARLELARLLLQNDDTDAAVKELEKAEKTANTGDTEFLIQAAETLMSAKKYDEALQKLEFAITSGRLALAPHIDANGRLHIDKSIPKAQQRDLRLQALRLARSYYLTAQCHFALRDLDKDAILAHVFKANRLDPANQEYVFFGGMVCEEFGDLSGAAGAWNRILEINPDNTAARTALNRVLPKIQQQQQVPLQQVPEPNM